MNPAPAPKPWIESALLGAALLALVIAGATAANLPSAGVWALITVLCAFYILSRGVARASWSTASAGRPAAARRTSASSVWVR